MHKIVFYPVGNGDTSQIILGNGKRILFDFCHIKETEDEENTRKEINLKARLRKELSDAGKSSFDVVAFTHSDKDHIRNSTEFFELQYAKKYQGDDRIKIDVLWVPAAMILEEATNDQQSDEFVIWRSEARHRLLKGGGIQVFSKPEKLKDWLEANNLTLESRAHLITDAGGLAGGFALDTDGVEFFCHSPFIKHVDGGDILRNEASLIFNVRLVAGTSTFDYLAIGDATWENMEDIVKTSKAHGNEDRLVWDIKNIAHHCSYLALSDEKGETETAAKPLVEELLLKGKEGAHLISSSNVIEDTQAAREQSLPPHIQAKKCYETYLKEINGGKFYVTMAEPSIARPAPLIFNVEKKGIYLEKTFTSAAAIITSSPAPKAG